MDDNETRPPDEQPDPDDTTNALEPEPPPATSTTPPPAPRSVQPDDVRAALLAAARLDWTAIDLDIPQAGFVCSVGSTVENATATILCDCGTSTVLTLDGESRARCPNCRAIFRHVLLVQREDQTPSAAALLVAEILEAAGLR